MPVFYKISQKYQMYNITWNIEKDIRTQENTSAD